MNQLCMPRRFRGGSLECRGYRFEVRDKIVCEARHATT